MSYNRLSPYCTKITTLPEHDTGAVRYHATQIVHWSPAFITLRNGGYQTVTTKRKMNQASHQFGLGYSVFQRNFDWFVTLPNGQTVEFEDGMTFPRPGSGWSTVTA